MIEAFCNKIERNQKRAGRQRQLREDEQVVLGLYKELQEKGLSPTTYTRNMILASTSKDSEEWSRLEAWAYSYLDGDVEEVVPDRKTFNAIFKVYYLAGDVTGAEKLLRKLLKWYSSKDVDKETDICMRHDIEIKVTYTDIRNGSKEWNEIIESTNTRTRHLHDAITLYTTHIR